MLFIHSRHSPEIMEENNKSINFKFYLLMFLMIVVWALAFPFIKISLDELSFINLTIMRFFVVSVAFGFVFLIKKKSFSKLQKKDIIPIFLLGFIGVMVYHFGLNYGEQLISPGAASLIIATIPVFILILAIVFLKEKIGIIKLLGIIIALVGVIVISIWGKEGESLEIEYIYAALAVLLAAIVGAFYTVAGKKLLVRYNALSLTVYAMLLGSLGLIPFVRVSLFEEVAQMSLQVWSAILFLGLFSSVIGYLLWFYALEIKTASEISVYLYAIPVVATIASYFLFADEITLMFVLGGILVIIGLVLVNKKWKQKID